MNNNDFMFYFHCNISKRFDKFYNNPINNKGINPRIIIAKINIKISAAHLIEQNIFCRFTSLHNPHLHNNLTYDICISMF